MRKALPILFLFCFFTFPAISSNVPAPQLSTSIEKKSSKELRLKSIASLKVKDLEKIAGRKLTLKEKITFLLLKKKLKQQEETSSTEGRTAFSSAVTALALLIIGLFVPYVILGSLVASIVAIVMGSSALKKNPNDRKAYSAKLLGWITLGAFALLLILVAIILSNWGW